MVLRRLQVVHGSELNNTRLLVVESPDGAGLSRALKGMGARKLTSTDSAESALELLLRQEFDFAVIENTLPRLTGLDLLQIVRQEWPETRVIITCGPPDERLAAAALKAGAVACVSRDELLAGGLLRAIEAAASLPAEGEEAAAQEVPDALAELIEGAQVDLDQLRQWVAAQHNTAYRLPQGDALHRQWLHSAFIHYMTASLNAFPAVPEREQESLVTLLLNYGCSPLEVVQAMQASLEGLKAGPELKEGFDPNLALLHFMLRLLQAYQTQMAVESLRREAGA